MQDRIGGAENSVLGMDEFITKYGVVIDGMTVSASMEITKQPSPYSPLKVGRIISCQFKGDAMQHIPQASRDMVIVMMHELHMQLQEAVREFYASPN
jgi:hypothetical protein